MRKSLILVAVLIAALALGAVAATAKHKGKATANARTAVTLGYVNNSTDPIYDPYSPSMFRGKVSAHRKIKINTKRMRGSSKRKARKLIKRQVRKKCMRGRTVRVIEAQGTVAGSSKTSRRGNYSVAVEQNLLPGTYTATTSQKRFRTKVKFKTRSRSTKRRGRVTVQVKVTCKRGASRAVAVG